LTAYVLRTAAPNQQRFYFEFLKKNWSLFSATVSEKLIDGMWEKDNSEKILSSAAAANLPGDAPCQRENMNMEEGKNMTAG